MGNGGMREMRECGEMGRWGENFTPNSQLLTPNSQLLTPNS
ncbi:MAG: hypothetical protein RMY29_017790 [Nostoc sp. CreGUA01]|nr:hypothetical protein [Nostoc sp. CreGUA01]